MARFRLTRAVAVSPFRFNAGQTVADSQVNAQPGDQIWPTLTAQTMIAGMQPLDASATNEPAVNVITGLDSINA